MSLPQFDPWSKTSSPGWRAYRAYRAYPEPKLGTLDTIGTGGGTNFRENEAGCVRIWLTRLTAADPAPNASAAKFCASAIRFCHGPWPAHLIALGWREADLFAVAVDGSRPGGLIPHVADGAIRMATSATVYFDNGNGLCAYIRGRSDLAGLPMIWDLDREAR